MKEYEIKVTSVDYYITYEDLNFDVYDTEEDDYEEAERRADEEIEKIKADLPQELELEITCEPEDLEDMIADAISDETGWLNNSFTYDIISEEEVEVEDEHEFEVPWGGTERRELPWDYTHDEDEEDEDDEDDLDEEGQSTQFFNVEIEILEYPTHKEVWLANDGSSGCHYEFNTKEELKQLIHEYVDDLIEYEYEEE